MSNNSLIEEDEEEEIDDLLVSDQQGVFAFNLLITQNFVFLESGCEKRESIIKDCAKPYCGKQFLQAYNSEISVRDRPSFQNVLPSHVDVWSTQGV